MRPVTMAVRLAPYLRYYSSRRPTDDHGVQPSVLVLFDDDVSEAPFPSGGGSGDVPHPRQGTPLGLPEEPSGSIWGFWKPHGAAPVAGTTCAPFPKAEARSNFGDPREGRGMPPRPRDRIGTDICLLRPIRTNVRLRKEGMVQ